MSVCDQGPMTFPGAFVSVPPGCEWAQGRHVSGATAPIVLVVDMEPGSRKTLRQLLEAAGCWVIESEGTHVSKNVSVIIIDLEATRTSDPRGIRNIRERFADAQVIAICGPGKACNGLAAMKEGAYDYLTKPWNTDELLIRVHRASQTARLTRANRCLKAAVCFSTITSEFVGSSARMQSVRSQVERLAPLDSTVLITGAAGTGKTVAAQLIHRSGRRRMEPFVRISCGEFPRELIKAELFGCEQGAVNDRPGRIELAHGGTLLIDEIGNLPIELQPVLLQFLQERTVRRVGSQSGFRVNVRIIAATNQDLAMMCQEHRFDQDLHSRLSAMSLHMPTVKERFIDVPELAYEILHRIARRRDGSRLMLSDGAMKAMQQHEWPGNIREMEDVLERAAISCTGTSIERKDLVLSQNHSSLTSPEDAAGLGLAGMTLSKIERCAVIETLKACGGNRVKTARQLGVSEKTIYNKIKQYRLSGAM